MFDFNAILQGVASSLITDKVKQPAEKAINEALNVDTGKSEREILAEIHELLILIYTKWRSDIEEQGDLYGFVNIVKNGTGSPFQPSHHGKRQHFQIFGATATLLNVAGSALGTFNITTKASDWTNIDFPDGCFYYLDNSVGVNSVTFWLRETDAAVV